jgi:hypothetical protein
MQLFLLLLVCLIVRKLFFLLVFYGFYGFFLLISLGMVQSKEQYSFVHLVTKDFISEENGVVPRPSLTASSDRRAMSGSHPIPDSFANLAFPTNNATTSNALKIPNECNTNNTAYVNGSLLFNNNSNNANLQPLHSKNRTYIMATSKNLSINGSEGIMPYKNHSESII